MPTIRVEVSDRPEHRQSNGDLLRELRAAGLEALRAVHVGRLYFLDTEMDARMAGRVASALLADPVTEQVSIATDAEGVPAPAGVSIEVHPRPGVMDPVAESTLAELREAGHPVEAVRTGRRYELVGSLSADDAMRTARRVLANESIEEVVAGTSGVRGAARAADHGFELRRVAIRDLDGAALDQLSRRGHLFLSRVEMEAIQAHYRALGRDPTDLELETLAQTWSEHCVHKTMKSRVVYRGAPLPPAGEAPDRATVGDPVELRFENLLKETIARATRELMEAGRGPECLSVFVDNAGVIGFDDEFGVAFKVETHNRPSAIEPYGGAATGVGGCIRDVLGCGLGARPIANTDVFCVAPGDLPADALPAGVLHPARVLRGVVRGVADYGNRMGIPTVNGAVHFDPRYLGNPLVFCGCVGLIPRDRVHKQPRSGDHVVVLGGRTGRDGIHGATFSSAELTDTHADEFSHAVQIGNAITEKRVLDAVLRARDAAGGPLFHAITDCGAGGLSSAIGEMAADLGATVELSHAPLKYTGLRYDEIWISEAQERMVLAVPDEKLAALLAIAREEEAEATVIGRFGEQDAGDEPVLRVHYRGVLVGEMNLAFLHGGLPPLVREAHWREPDDAGRPDGSSRATTPKSPERRPLERLRELLNHPTLASKEWIIRGYDHEVQGGSVVKPLMGRGGGPTDAAVLRPRLDSRRGIALACGLAPHLSDRDPYWMALAAMDEALRNIVCVGGDPRRTAVLDNFCWGRTDDPEQLGALVRACAACRDGALAFGTPFISGKDSLNNEFALEAGDVERVAALVADRLAADPLQPDEQRRDVSERVAARIRRTGRVAIPPTLLISAISLIDDVARCVTSDLKRSGAELLLVRGRPVMGYRLSETSAIHRAVAEAIAAGHVAAAHDVSEGGWLVSVAEMAVGGGLGARLRLEAGEDEPFGERVAAYVLETRSPATGAVLARSGVDVRAIGETTDAPELVWGDERVRVDDLANAWRRSGS